MNQLKRTLLLSVIVITSFIHCFSQTKKAAQNKQLQKELEQQLFPGTKLPANFHYSFPFSFEEHTIKTGDGTTLHALLFPADSSKGVVLYLHGSIGDINTWGKVAPVYTLLHYDVFMLDYRGYGKSGGKVSSEGQVQRDVQTAYNFLKQRYPENKIVILGQSLGTGPAAMLAATNQPQLLVLQAPYYSIADWLHKLVPALDTSGLKYRFKTYQYLQKTTSPVVIFHGDADDAVYYGSSEKLRGFFKKGDRLFTLKGEGHNDFTKNADYLKTLKTILQ